MSRTARKAPGGLVYHVMNRGVGRQTLFHKDEDYAAFERVMAEAHRHAPTRILAYTLMPNHWHFVIWPREDGELTEFVRWMTHTHTQRWHAHYHTSGSGHLYQTNGASKPLGNWDWRPRCVNVAGRRGGTWWRLPACQRKGRTDGNQWESNRVLFSCLKIYFKVTEKGVEKASFY